MAQDEQAHCQTPPIEASKILRGNSYLMVRTLD